MHSQETETDAIWKLSSLVWNNLKQTWSTLCNVAGNPVMFWSHINESTAGMTQVPATRLSNTTYLLRALWTTSSPAFNREPTNDNLTHKCMKVNIVENGDDNREQ